MKTNWKIIIVLALFLSLFFNLYLYKALIEKKKELQVTQSCRLDDYKRITTAWADSIKYQNKTIDVVLIGDSLIAHHDSQKDFPEYSILCAGIPGDAPGDALNRLEIIKSANPKKVFIELGVNGLLQEDVSHNIEYYNRILEDIQLFNPQIELYVISVLPVATKGINDGIAPTNEVINLRPMVCI